MPRPDPARDKQATFRRSPQLRLRGWPGQLNEAVALYDCGVTADATSRGEFIDSLMDTELYSIGAYFCDEHPELVDEVVSRSEEIERAGLEEYAPPEARRSRRRSRRS